eukprot:1427421-Amphidinium_carterae.1
MASDVIADCGSCDPGSLYSLALQVLPMGDKKAMEVAQLVHQSLVLCCSSLGWKNMLMYNWELPRSPLIWGCYCDDFMQLAILEPEPCARKAHSEVVKGYDDKHFLRKAGKAELEVEDAKFWGAEVHSREGRIRGDKDKLRLLCQVTTSIIFRPFVSGALIEGVVGFWTHFMLFNRQLLCLFDEIYRWVRRIPRGDRFKLTRLSRMARAQLCGAVPLADLLHVDLRSAISPRMHLSDASQHKAAVAFADADICSAVLAWSSRTGGYQGEGVTCWGSDVHSVLRRCKGWAVEIALSKLAVHACLGL